MVHQRLAIISCSLFLSLATLAQEADVILSQFIATPLEETVFLRWTITAGNTCQDTYVERSENQEGGFQRIGLIGGICGSPNESITYEFHDSLPLPNRTVYYRLQLGQWGFTSAKSVEYIQYNEQGFLLAPNPFRDQTRLNFKNRLNEEHTLVIIDIQGRVVAELISSGDSFYVPRGNLSAGSYIFKVSRNGQVIFDGRLMVL